MESHDLPGNLRQGQTLLEVSEAICAHRMRRLRRAVRVSVVLLLCGCAAGVSRYGYVMDPSQVGRACDVAIKRNFRFSDQEMATLGNIEVHDSYGSGRCDEGAVFDVVIADACGLGADVINVTDEKQPDYLWTLCYGLDARFLKFADREQARYVESDPHYELSAIQQRATIGKQKADSAHMAAVVSGFVGGFIGGALAASSAVSK